MIQRTLVTLVDFWLAVLRNEQDLRTGNLRKGGRWTSEQHVESHVFDHAWS